MDIIIENKSKGTKIRGIMEAALKLFVEKGINATTIKDIASEAKVSEGALYRHFKSKDDLAWYLFSVHLNEFSMNLLEKISKEVKFKNKIGVFIRECLAGYESNKDLFTFMIISEHRELNKYPPTYTHPGQIVLRLIEEGQSAGEFKQYNKYVLSSILLGSVIRLCAIKVYGAVSQDLVQFADEASASIWEALKS